MDKIPKNKEDWKKKLSPEQFRVTREKGTEAPFKNAYWNLKEKGIYKCSNCGLDLFSSEKKYDSKTGWPSFYETLKKENIKLLPDNSHGMNRTEIVCARCDAHLGHLFDDGPKPTGKRYCLNSISLKFIPKNK